MHKVKPPRSKRSLVTVLSLGFIALGIGCISWAMLSIWAAPDDSADAAGSRYPIPTAFLTELNELKGVARELNKVLYPVCPAEGDDIGSLTIPALNQQLPIVQGTDAEELKRGVGHFTQSVLPGEKDNCVLSAHRDTFFSQLGKLQVGDQLIMQTSAGTFTYEVRGTRIVDKDDKTVIVPIDHAVLTLTTCYPFDYHGSAPDRYIISADLTESKLGI